ncbi:MAG: ABC transporter ATP-binding protein [Candidatus Kariarchaeaceae archaeon]|jgi:ABC-type phosphate transport system ATPase subunit
MHDSNSKTILDLNQLSLSIAGTSILENITCSFPKGKTIVIVGPSGAGKSSLLKCINRIYQFEGEISYNKISISNINIRKLRKELAYVPQAPVVFPGTVEDNILWGRKLWGMTADYDIASRFLDSVGLAEDCIHRDASKLSLGQQQRLHLARTLAIEPQILLLDEPASSLDAISKDAFEKLIQQLKNMDPNLTILVITHDLDQAKRIAEFAILLDKGMIILKEKADQFFNRVLDLPQAEMLQELLAMGNHLEEK